MVFFPRSFLKNFKFCSASAAFLVAVSGTCLAATPAIPFTVNLSENVTVNTTGGTPRIAVDVGGNTRYASYTSGSGTSALTFTYTATAGDLDLDGVTLTSPMQLNGGTIKDTAGNDATLTFTVPNTSNVKVSYPSLAMDFVYDSDGRYSLNGTIYNDLTSFLSATGGTFSRASIGTYFDSAGTMQTATSGTPRFDYDPTTHVAKGVLIEESRTNILLHSNAFTTAPWDTTTCGGLTNSGSTTTAPDGSSVPIYDFSTTGCVFQDVAISNGVSYTHSVWIKANKTATLGFRTPGTSATTSTALSVNTSWQRFTLTSTSVATNTRFLIDNRAANGYGTTGLQISFFGGQIEQASFASSYIPTTSTTAVRSAELLSVPTTGWLNSTSGTLYGIADAPLIQNGIYRRVASINDGTVSNSVSMILTDSGANLTTISEIINTGVNQFSSLQGTFSPNTTIKQAVGYTNNNARSSVMGTLGTADTSVSVPTISSLYLGTHSSSQQRYINGHVTAFKYYPLRATDTQLQLLTQ